MYKLSFITILTCFSFVSNLSAKEILTIECSVGGTSIQTFKLEKKISEKIVYEYGETDGGFKFYKTDFFVEGKKIDSHIISKSDFYMVAGISQSAGKGYGRKVYVLNNFYDFESKEVTRLMITYPEGVVEKNTGKCTLNKQKQ